MRVLQADGLKRSWRNATVFRIGIVIEKGIMLSTVVSILINLNTFGILAFRDCYTMAIIINSDQKSRFCLFFKQTNDRRFGPYIDLKSD